jgi:hypothetical protein
MAQRRINEVAFNFDSLTDMITNLAGGLILIVLLLTVLNRQRTIQAGSEAKANAHRDAATGRSLELVLLKREVTALERDRLPVLDSRIRIVGDELEALRKEVDSKQPRASADPMGKPGTPSRVDFRPPILKKATKQTGPAFVLTNGKVYSCLWSEYLAAYKEECEKIAKAPTDSPEMQSYQEGVLIPLASGDFDMQIKVTEVNTVTNKIRVVASPIRKPVAHGELFAQAMAVNSDFGMLLERFEPDAHYVYFEVYPDSFEQFVELRRRATAQGFTYDWTPQPAGKDPIWSPGEGVTH